MVQTLNIANDKTPKWFKCLKRPVKEFPGTSLSVLQGVLPAELSGTLYCNGPAKFERAGIRANHWFDGDGAVLAVRFGAGQAQGTYRYVKTQGYVEEEEAGQFLYGGYNSSPITGPREPSKCKIKNTANSSILVLQDRILALWEGGRPYALDPVSLQTIGLDSMGGLEPELPEQMPPHAAVLEGGKSYSAHPKRDPITGNIYNFGVSLGADCKLFIYESDRTGQIQNQSQTLLGDIPFIHDFALAGPYLVFCISPVFLRDPIAILQGEKSYSDCLQWESEQGTRILIFDRETLEVVADRHVDPWYQWHFANGFVNADGLIQLSLCKHKDFATNQHLTEVTADQPDTVAHAVFWELLIDPQTGALKGDEVLAERDCEYPQINPEQLGQPHDRTYFSIRGQCSDPSGFLNGLACFNHNTGQLKETKLPDHYYPTEPIYVANPTQADAGWVVSVIYDGEHHASEVWIFDRDRLDAEPVCRLGLPSFVPIQFHGVWHPQS